MKLSIVIPVYNERDIAPEAIARVESAPLPLELEREIVIVDDYSTDGTRFLGHTHRVLYHWHAVGNWLLTTLSNMLSNVNLTDMECCYKVVRRDVLARLTLVEDRFGFEPEATAKVARLGCRIYEVPVSYSGRTYAEGKKISWKDGFSALRCILRYNLLG